MLCVPLSSDIFFDFYPEDENRGLILASAFLFRAISLDRNCCRVTSPSCALRYVRQSYLAHPWLKGFQVTLVR